MSVSDTEISSVGDSGVGVSGSGGGDDHDDDDDDDDDDQKKHSGGVHQKANYDDQRTKQRARGYNNISGFPRNLGKAKKFVLRPFKTKLSGRSKSSPSSSFSGKRIDVDNGGGNKGCCFCFTPTPSGESAAIGSQFRKSDPNHPTFTYDMLGVLIEKSDFYSKECNTHLASDVSFGEE